MCVTSAIVANAPAIAAGLAGGVAALKLRRDQAAVKKALPSEAASEGPDVRSMKPAPVPVVRRLPPLRVGKASWDEEDV